MLYGQLSEKADVYSFGVLILEVVSGVRNKDPTQAEDDVYLPTRAWRLHKEDRLKELMDPRLQVGTNEEMEVHHVLKTAVMFGHKSPERRPTMFRVVAMLAAHDTGSDTASESTDPDSVSWSDYQKPSEVRAQARFRLGRPVEADEILRPSIGQCGAFVRWGIQTRRTSGLGFR